MSPKTYSSAIREANNYTRWVIDALRPHIGGRTIEIGFGHDGYYQELKNLVSSYCGADIDPDAVAEARLAHPGTPYFVWDVSDSGKLGELGRGGYDTVISINTLEHVSDDALAVANMLELLPPRGRLLLFVPAHQALYNTMDRLAGHHRRYSKRNMQTLLSRFPVDIEVAEYFNPLGGLGWWANKFASHAELDSGAINGQIRAFDRYVLPVSRLLSPLTQAFFGQSVMCVVRKRVLGQAEASADSARIDQQTIEDFGRQWSTFTDNSAYYGSARLFADIVEPLLPVSEVVGLRTADIGSGTGRIVNMLLEAGASSVIAVEPSEAVHALRRNVEARKSLVEIMHIRGDEIPPGLELDLIVSIGVLHHIVDPSAVVRAAYQALRPGGRMLAWVYGREGNGLYLATFLPIRKLTAKLPHKALNLFCHCLLFFANMYGHFCTFLPLPMREYMRGYFMKLTNDKRHLVVYDQLNPAHAEYYTSEQARRLLETGGFTNVELYHRHGYSWTVIGQRPSGKDQSRVA